MIKLDLTKLKHGQPCLTPEFGTVLAQAASVCFEGQNHSSDCEMVTRGHSEGVVLVRWEMANDQMRRCWNDPDEATEFGAVGVAVSFVQECLGMTVVERSFRGTGIDYWLGHEGEELFQKASRLEVSGIRTGKDSQIAQRVRQKELQTRRSDGELPAVIIVVEFGHPVTHVLVK